MHDHINIKTLSLDELIGVVNLYPWYGAARKELCLRMAKSGGEAWGKEQFSDAALYVGSRKMVSDIYRMNNRADCSDKDMEDIVRSYIEKDKKSTGEDKVRVVGGDYFTQLQYDGVKNSEDGVFSKFISNSKGEEKEKGGKLTLDETIYTETLAEIYASQGYFGQARQIYSKLILAFPEKFSYFAALIEKLDKEANS